MTRFLTFFFLLSFAGISYGQIAPELTEKFKEFNFWIGEWDVYKQGTDTLVGRSKIESIVDNVSIRESYWSANSNYHGTSLNKFNTLSGQWEQFWVDNTGLTLHTVGNIEGDKMVLSCTLDLPAGEVVNKIVWTPNEDGTVRQEWFQRASDTEVWSTVFDGHYRPRKKE